jgi:hypothetical protein
MRCLTRLLFLPLLLQVVPPVRAYSVLTHEAIIDRNWKDEIEPKLLARFPATTKEQLRDARAYAYGGAILQDMGYYPFGSKLFSDILHYVRSGDFVVALLRDAQDVNEYAFGLGALAHYAADNEGHPVGVNRVVPMMYPNLRKKFGANVTYEDDPGAHLKTEFGFDVVQVSRGKYASEDFHDFIGFKVSRPLLARAFEETYSVPLDRLFSDLDLSLGTFRFGVSKVIPEMTKTAWASKKDDIKKLDASITKQKFVYKVSRARYHQEYDRNYQQPGFGARFLAFLFHLIPKVGPFKAFAFKVPSPEAEKLFFASFKDTMTRYQALLAVVGPNPLELQNENFDIGRPTKRGDYRMADDTYRKLLEHLEGAEGKISSDLRKHILDFYEGSNGPESEKARAVFVAIRSAPADSEARPKSSQ